jgi:Outer membrane lipoprotein carrier protein LolA-like
MTSGSSRRSQVRMNGSRARYRLASGLLLLWPLVAWSANDDLDALMSLLAQRKSSHAYFVEQHFVAVLDRPVQSSGELYYEAPDRLERRTLKPRTESMLVDRGALTIQLAAKRRTVKMKEHPELAAFIESIRATLAGDLPALRRLFKVGFSGSAAQWSLELVPTDPKLLAAIQRVHIQGMSENLQLIEILQADGDRSVMTIQPAP